MSVVTENLNNLARNIDLLGGLGGNQALLGLITFIGLFLQLVLNLGEDFGGCLTHRWVRAPNIGAVCGFLNGDTITDADFCLVGDDLDGTTRAGLHGVLNACISAFGAAGCTPPESCATQCCCGLSATGLVACQGPTGGATEQ